MSLGIGGSAPPHFPDFEIQGYNLRVQESSRKKTWIIQIFLISLIFHLFLLVICSEQKEDNSLKFKMLHILGSKETQDI